MPMVRLSVPGGLWMMDLYGISPEWWGSLRRFLGIFMLNQS